MLNDECRTKRERGARLLRRAPSPFSIQHSAFSIRSRRPGFTLLELVVVMLVLSVLFAMAAPSLSGFGAGREAEQTASQIVTLARWAREQAITEGRVYRLNFDTTNRGYFFVTAANGNNFERLGTEFGRDFLVPDGVTLAFDLPQAGGFPYLEFLPSGRSQPARVRVTAKDGQTTELASLSATEPIRVVTAEEMQEAGIR